MTHQAGERAYQRDESAAHRLDRNYGELLQELRVAQTGVQILFAFLLGIAFQQRFAALGGGERAVYVVTLVSSAFAAVLLIAPVAGHRILFGRHRKDEVVVLTGRLAACGLFFLGVSILSAVALVLMVVSGGVVAAAITSVLGLTVLMLWLVIPMVMRRRPG